MHCGLGFPQLVLVSGSMFVAVDLKYTQTEDKYTTFFLAYVNVSVLYLL